MSGLHKTNHEIHRERFQKQEERRDYPVSIRKEIEPLPEVIELTPARYGQIISAMRCKRNLFQKELAKSIGISTQALCKIEAGKVKKVSKKYIYAFAHELNCSVAFLLGETENPEVIINFDEKKDDRRELYAPIEFDAKNIGELSNALRALERTDEELFDLLFEAVTTKSAVRRKIIKALLQAGLTLANSVQNGELK